MSRLLRLLVPSLLTACDYSRALESDPTFYDPPRADAREVDAGGSAPESGAPVGCLEVPGYDPELIVSSADAESHLPGKACLLGCHEEGGEARLVFEAAGTVYRSQTSRETAAAGNEVHGVGGTTLTLDRCGNFWAVADALQTPARSTQPWVKNPSFRRMEKSLSRERSPGDCNGSDCHDFSERTNWGIYY